MEQTRAETEMRYLIESYDGRLGSPAVTVERLQMWTEEIADLRRRAGARIQMAAAAETDQE